MSGEEVGLGRGHWAESGSTQGGVGGASTRGGVGGRARDRGAPPRPLGFLRSCRIEPGAPSPREQSPRPLSSSLLRVPWGGTNKSLTQHPFPPRHPPAHPFLPFIMYFNRVRPRRMALSPGPWGCPLASPRALPGAGTERQEVSPLRAEGGVPSVSWGTQSGPLGVLGPQPQSWL